ncbi:uncharacterized protein LOC122023056 [Zingiber officinale]|uniref:uncharacterized protein LOC122023056 n=1 Tax=Zingiber officinale TaxID=94328 RepID=UPI001C4D97BE|nr:uncharacterized protein LOC122023056 [Zingiber officinale]
MDKAWMKLPRYSPEYINGVEVFLNYAYTKGNPQGVEILCPCAKCHNAFWRTRAVVLDHLIGYGFEKGYDVWVRHGEGLINPMDLNGDMDDREDAIDDIDGLLYEQFRDVAQEENGVGEGPNEDAKKFYNLLEDAKQELYPGCKNFTKLSFTIRLYLLKCLHGWSNASFNALLVLLRESMPQLNIPDSLNKTRGMIRDLGLDYKKIDACPNDCMLYWKDHENDTSCHVCGAPRWIENVEGDRQLEENKKAYKISGKVLRHFPLIPRLQRLFLCSKTAGSLRWHEEERSKDGKLRHPADGEAWKDFDKCHPNFASDSRNIRLGLTSDGFNPFRSMNVSHSTWPVVLIPYNFPPWWCMKAEYAMLSLLIPGPQSPGNNIDVYLQPLIEELKLLWDSGVETYDSSLNQTFQMRAALLWTISDFPGYAMLSGWSTKGKLACPCCNYNTNSTYLRYSRKMCYMDHRVFLPMDHEYRSNTRAFNGRKESRPPPTLLKGKDTLELLENFNNVFGKMQKKLTNGPWKKKSIFFELSYWKHNSLRHNLDVMHIEKNIFDNIIGTLLDIPGKTKDHEKARFDLQDMGIRKKLHPKETNEGKNIMFSKACFSMTPNEKTIFCGVLKKAKIPDGCASNISRCVHVAEKKIYGYKSHDAHFILHYLLQVAVRSTMSNQVSHPLIRLCSFFRCLCQKVIDVGDLNILQSEITETLCQLETIFPPSFFDIMVHLPIHLVDEIKLGGPVQFRWMYFPERYLGKLKSYVRNKSRPEGSIAEGYLVEECLTLCSRYLHGGVETRLNRMTRNSDRCDPCEVGIGHSIGSAKVISLEYKLRSQAHRYILFNHDEVQEFIREHENVITNVKKRKKWSKAKSQGQDFVEWFKNRALMDDVPDHLKELSRGPNTIARCFSSYVINGYRFHTKQRDAKRKTQNSGVSVVSVTQSFASTKDENPTTKPIAYYGSIIEIIELDYYGSSKFVLFRCDWYEVEDDKYGLTCVYFNKRCYVDDPFVLASQVHQCFYIEDPFDANRKYVMKTVPRDFFNMKDDINSNAQELYQSEPSDHAVNLAIVDSNYEVELVRDDMPATVIENPFLKSNMVESEDQLNFDATLSESMD